MRGYHVAVVGATGAVGTRMLKMVAESKLPIASVLALASKRSEGKQVPYRDGTLTVHETTDDSFKGIDIFCWRFSFQAICTSRG